MPGSGRSCRRRKHRIVDAQEIPREFQARIDSLPEEKAERAGQSLLADYKSQGNPLWDVIIPRQVW